jgi:alpha-galactosidase
VGRQAEKERLSRIVCRCHSDSIPVSDKQAIMSEEMLVIATEKALEGLYRYVGIVSQRMGAVPLSKVPTGWCSWYFYYTQPDEEEVLANTRFLQKRFGKEIDWIQLDDGYQKTVGDWRVNSRFEKGLKNLVQNVKKNGYRAGVWTAPFVATEHSELFKTRPEWFVRDERNEPIAVDENPLWLGKYYALDLTNPEVLEHIESVFKSLKADGFEYFKIDFLYHALKEGVRMDKGITRAQSLRKGLEAIRKAVGHDLILGCGAPFGPCVGMVNAMRIGNDIAPSWRYTWGAGVYECAINTMNRAVLHQRWWTNDPDCLLVRQDDSELTIDELLLWASVIALSGGALVLSDRMMDVSEERLQIIDRILPPYGGGAIAVDSLALSEPTSFVLPIETSLGRWAVVAAVNLTERPLDVSVRLEDAGLDASQLHHVFEFWKQEYLGLTENEITVRHLKPHSCQLLLVRPESAIPSVLSTSIHFTQGAVELDNSVWDSAKHELTVTLKRSTRKPEAVFFVGGKTWAPMAAFVDDKEVKLEPIAPEVVAVRHVFKAGQIIRVSYNA